MNPVTATAFFDELSKIAKWGEHSLVGGLINQDKQQFPTSDTQGSHLNSKRQDRAENAHSQVQTSPDPEEKAPSTEHGTGGPI